MSGFLVFCAALQGGTNAGVTFTSGTQFIFGGGNLSVDYSYDIRFTLTDAFGTVTVVDSLSTASVLMDFKAGGTGLAVGKVSETDYRQISPPAKATR